MTLTRMHFEFIARTIRRRLDTIRERAAEPTADSRIMALHALARDFADALNATNPRFNRTRFLHACGFDLESA